METNTALDLELLAELRGALTEFDVRSQLREEVGSLAVSTEAPGVYVWVFVSFNRRYFSWSLGNNQHPVSDIPGTARRIAGHVNGLHLMSGGAE